MRRRHPCCFWCAGCSACRIWRRILGMSLVADSRNVVIVTVRSPLSNVFFFLKRHLRDVLSSLPPPQSRRGPFTASTELEVSVTSRNAVLYRDLPQAKARPIAPAVASGPAPATSAGTPLPTPPPIPPVQSYSGGTPTPTICTVAVGQWASPVEACGLHQAANETTKMSRAILQSEAKTFREAGHAEEYLTIYVSRHRTANTHTHTSFCLSFFLRFIEIEEIPRQELLPELPCDQPGSPM